MLRILASITLCLFSATLRAADLSGHWQGAIELPADQKLAFDVDFTRTGESYEGDISILVQALKDVPLEDITFAESGETSFAITGIPGEPTFSGRLEGDAVTGQFEQAGQSYPFSMERADEAAASAGPSLEDFQKRLDGLDEEITTVLREFRVPGLALGVVVGQSVVATRGYGVRNVDTKEPVDGDTLFAIGSTTKAFTSFLLGMLVDEGKLAWSGHVREYLPEFRLKDSFATERMKVRNLLNHSSGLPRHDFSWLGSPASRADLFARLRHLEPTRELGERFQYQNLMYLAAGVLAEKVSGESWEELITRRIFVPLGMKRSSVSLERFLASANRAFPHRLGEGATTLVPYRNIDAVGPAGSINSSVAEMARWMRLQFGRGEFEGQRLLKVSTLREIYTPRMALGEFPQSRDHIPVGYGLGWTLEVHRGRFLAQHGGGIDGFISWVALAPFEEVGVVVLTNADGHNPLPERVGRTVLDRMLELEPRNYLEQARAELGALRTRMFLQKRTAKKAAADKGRGETPPALSFELEAYAGRFTNAGYGTLEIRHTIPDSGGERLVLHYNGFEVALEHWHFDTFRPSPEAKQKIQTTVQFTLDAGGGLAAVEIPFEAQVGAIRFEKQRDVRLAKPSYLDRFVGRYDLGPQAARFRLRKNGEETQLELSLPQQPLYHLEPVRERVFRIAKLEGFTVEFIENEAGEVEIARFHQPNGTFDGKRAAKRSVPANPEPSKEPAPEAKPPRRVQEI